MSKKEKETIKMLEQERNLLKITLEHLVKENDDLKRTIEDMKITVKANKDQLSEYISTITNKDMVVEKMNNTISQLRYRLESMEEQIKKQQRQQVGAVIQNSHSHSQTAANNQATNNHAPTLIQEKSIKSSDEVEGRTSPRFSQGNLKEGSHPTNKIPPTSNTDLKSNNKTIKNYRLNLEVSLNLILLETSAMQNEAPASAQQHEERCGINQFKIQIAQ